MGSRSEILLKAMLNGESIEHEPQSRIEKALVACLNKSGSNSLPEAQSRMESLLHLLADDMASGGSGGGATAYTVSSVDELPSNAVDGSIAKVQVNHKYLGTWYWQNGLPSTIKSYEVEFECDGVVYKTIYDYGSLQYNDGNNTVTVYTSSNR